MNYEEMQQIAEVSFIAGKEYKGTFKEWFENEFIPNIEVNYISECPENCETQI